MTRSNISAIAPGENTRRALVEAAIEVFGRDGYHAASTRSLSAAAGANQALIGYHFGGKEGLYLAVFEHITDAIASRMIPLANAIAAEMASGAKRNSHLSFLHRITDAMAEIFVAPESKEWARLILREQQDPSPAFDILYQGAIGRVLGLIEELLDSMRPAPVDIAETRVLAFTILGQALVFRVAFAAVIRHTGWTEISKMELEMIKAQIRRNVTAMLR